MPFLEESTPELFAGQYLTSYFTGIKRDTVTNYEVQANTSSGIIVGLRSAVIPATPIGTVKIAVDALAVENVPHVKYRYNSYSNVTNMNIGMQPLLE